MNNKQQSMLEISQLATNSLLSLHRGVLATTIIPTAGSIDWIVPSALILAVLPFEAHAVISNTKQHTDRQKSKQHPKHHEHGKRYQWQQQAIRLYSLLPHSAKADKVVILEGIDDDARIGLLIQGSLIQYDMNLSDIKDIESDKTATGITTITTDIADDVLQLVSVQQRTYAIPDLALLDQKLR